MHENQIIVLPVITHRCGMAASWAAQHTTMCFNVASRYCCNLANPGEDIVYWLK